MRIQGPPHYLQNLTTVLCKLLLLETTSLKLDDKSSSAPDDYNS